MGHWTNCRWCIKYNTVVIIIDTVQIVVTNPCENLTLADCLHKNKLKTDMT